MQEGAKIDAYEGCVGTTLCAAAYGGDKEIVEWLLDEVGTDVDARGSRCGFSCTALYAAMLGCEGEAEGSHEAIVRLLAEEADFNSIGYGLRRTMHGNKQFRGAAAFITALDDNFPLFRFLSDRGADSHKIGSGYSWNGKRVSGTIMDAVTSWDPAHLPSFGEYQPVNIKRFDRCPDMMPKTGPWTGRLGLFVDILSQFSPISYYAYLGASDVT